MPEDVDAGANLHVMRQAKGDFMEAISEPGQAPISKAARRLPGARIFGNVQVLDNSNAWSKDI